MKKHKIKSIANYADMHDETVLEGKDGTNVTVRDHIPYSQKIEMARRTAEETIMIHDDSCWYFNYMENAIMYKYVAEYYTDINTDGIEAEQIVDYLVNNNLLYKILDYINDDYRMVMDLYNGITNSYSTTFDDDRSLRKAVRTSFGFLFNGEDITESMAKAEMTKNTIYNALNALHSKEEKDEKNLNHDGTLSIGGNIIQFGKKE